ncbi:DUF115 domain-containing protein [Candidatus Nitrosotenuis chungbukensis]|uniref:6-hydroxymethylpterin diphosphokinase MptE-like protein n=1 Tax=Candidatus Nitrosotenuis chungbukensis TaxID=1353246 RepID=UPI0005B25DEB|nr:6-hydroxymethylpterin diphosphokinase MptE-like protein [Candidatus Nitrosotenuis chungbukensis]WKT58709.1 DUF115 domain-containing protein [Candidatus Nitrosotenuis chungbukensis]
MTISGWNSKYEQIAREFGYSKKDDLYAAVLLDSIIKKRFSLTRLKKMICGKTVFVIGAGPSLQSSIDALKKHKGAITICADGAVTLLIQNGIRPKIVVTDLDGDLESLKKIKKTNTVFVVHAHGDNADRLDFVRNFKNCVGTTQTKEIGKVCNFGGFTDGDRCVFLASHFGAKKIVLFGMDFGTRIGKYSKTNTVDKKTKRKKLKRGKALLEWLATKSKSEFFTLSKPIRGFKKITYRNLEISF